LPVTMNSGTALPPLMVTVLLPASMVVLPALMGMGAVRVMLQFEPKVTVPPPDKTLRKVASVQSNTVPSAWTDAPQKSKMVNVKIANADLRAAGAELSVGIDEMEPECGTAAETQVG